MNLLKTKLCTNKVWKEHIGANSFSHFWEDGIKEGINKEEEVSIGRRKVILSIRDSLNNSKDIARPYIKNKSIEKGLLPETVDNIIDEFIQRRILKDYLGKLSFVMEFFRTWLVEVGYEQIIPTFDESEKINQKKIYEENLRIKTPEVDTLITKFSTYKNQKILSESIVKWLSQFGEPSNQRLAFNLLKNVKLYSELEIRNILESMYLEIQRRANKLGYIRIIEPKNKYEEVKLKRDDILVSYIDEFAKCGSEFAKKFVEANNIYYKLATDFNSIQNHLENKNIKMLLFVDDIIVTGKSFCN